MRMRNKQKVVVRSKFGLKEYVRLVRSRRIHEFYLGYMRKLEQTIKIDLSEWL